MLVSCQLPLQCQNGEKDANTVIYKEAFVSVVCIISAFLGFFFFLCIRMWYHGSTERGDLLSLSHSLHVLFFLNIPSLHTFACDRLCIMAFNWSLWAGRICVLCAIQEQQHFELDILTASAAPLDSHSSCLCTPSLVLECIYFSCCKISPWGLCVTVDVNANCSMEAYMLRA